MIKNLLSLALMSSLAIGANAYNVDDMIYTRAAKYKVTAANLVTNGNVCKYSSSTHITNTITGGCKCQ